MIDILIVAAGSGQRMGADHNKLYLKLLGKPILYHSMFRASLSPLVSRIFPVIKKGEEGDFADMISEFGNISKLQPPIFGGAERFDSAKAGLVTIMVSDPNKVVMVHDAARPLVTNQMIEDLYNAVDLNLCAVPTLAVADTTREMVAGKTKLLDRSNLYSMQTPQAFLASEIEEVFFTDVAQKAEPTDEAGYFELAKKKVVFTMGRKACLKITTPEDLIVAEAFLKAEG
ncbi:MAG: IspD/TarI family cytidylyltransferase [SAR324 cluster bacterium]|nr:IspD/TarI family cytidylyltransferase [SAR324 cluster bacterium]